MIQNYNILLIHKNFTRILFFTIALLFTNIAKSQYYDDFSDGETRNNPTWFASCAEQYMAKNGVKLSIADNCTEGMFKTPSLATTDISWSCTFTLNTSANTKGCIDYHLTSALLDLGHSSGLLVRVDVGKRQLSFVVTSSTDEGVLAQSEIGALPLDAELIEIVVEAVGNHYTVSVTTDNIAIWHTKIEYYNTSSSVMSGVRLTRNSANEPSIEITLGEIYCGEKQTDEQGPSCGELFFNEIMYDPSPAVGLPEVEWVELHNATDRHINLADCQLSTSSKYGIVTESSIPPHGYVVLASESAYLTLLDYGIKSTIVVGMPSLSNDGDCLTLTNRLSEDVAQITYDPRWISDKEKREGGWSLECHDLSNPLANADTWGVSVDPRGGTPGETNSVAIEVIDSLMPRINSVGMLSTREVVVRMNKPMDCSLDPTVEINKSVTGSSWLDINRKDIVLTLREPLDSLRPTEIELTELYCISGYPLSDTTIAISSPCKVGYMDVIFNEILCYVDSTQSKFIELYNNSNHWIDAATLSLCNPDENSGGVKNTRPLATKSTLLSPKQIIVAVAKPTLLHTELGVSSSAIYVENKLPSIAANQGELMLVDESWRTIDAIQYNYHWHHYAVKDRHNVSLERVSPLRATADSTNWQSASTASGYNTAGWQNSQATDATANRSRHYFALDKEWFSPNGDGTDDFAEINYQMPSDGYTLSADIYTRSGDYICHIINNHILGSSGTYLWNGKAASGIPVEAGVYVVLLRATSPHGKTITETLVIAKL